MTSFGSLMRRRRREVTMGELLREFHFRDLLYLWGHRAAELEIVPGLRSRFGPSEKFLFFSLKNSILLLRKRGFGVTFSDGQIVVTNFPYLEQPLRLPVPTYGPRELRNLFTLLRHGLTHGAGVGAVGARVPPRFWTLDVDHHLVTVNGTVRFYLDLIDPWTLTETYTLGIHQFARFEGTTVLDVGAEFGDSSLFFAAQGARVIAVEPVATNFDALQRNIALNEGIGPRVGPVHAAIGPTGRQKMYRGFRPSSKGMPRRSRPRGRSVPAHGRRGRFVLGIRPARPSRGRPGRPHEDGWKGLRVPAFIQGPGARARSRGHRVQSGPARSPGRTGIEDPCGRVRRRGRPAQSRVLGTAGRAWDDLWTTLRRPVALRTGSHRVDTASVVLEIPRAQETGAAGRTDSSAPPRRSPSTPRTRPRTTWRCPGPRAEVAPRQERGRWSRAPDRVRAPRADDLSSARDQRTLGCSPCIATLPTNA